MSEPSEPIRPFTPQQLRVAKGIARNLSYAEIGLELGCAEATVRSHVKAMSLILDEPKELPPRWRILMHMKHREWEQQQAAAEP